MTKNLKNVIKILTNKNEKKIIRKVKTNQEFRKKGKYLWD